jgi:probable HAF family extracellular repeat protein
MEARFLHVMALFAGASFTIAFTSQVRSQPPVIHVFPETGLDSRVWALSGNGSVAFGTFKQSDSSAALPFRWSLESGITYLDTVEGYTSAQPWKASFDGSVVVGRVYNGSYEGYRAAMWTAAGVQELGLLSPTDTKSAAWGVSANGQVVVGQSEVGGSSRAFRWTTASGMEDLGSFNSADYVTARSVSGDGSLIVGTSGNRAFGWTQDQGMLGIAGPDGAMTSYATAASADGRYVAGYFAYEPGDTGTVLWSDQGGVESVEVISPGPFSDLAIPYAISADGSTVVGSYIFGRGVIWTPSTGLVGLYDHLSSLGTNLEGWSRFGDVTDVSADGKTIVGTGTYLGTMRGFMVTAVPEPSTYALLAMSAAGALWMARRRR